MSFRWHRHLLEDGSESFLGKRRHTHRLSQCFAFQRLAVLPPGVLGRTIFELKEDEQTVYYRTHASGEFSDGQAADQLRGHLGIGRGVDSTTWVSSALSPAQFTRAAAVIPGVRVLQIKPLEALISFMGSANNNIKRNMQMVEKLCAEFEENRIGDDAYGQVHYSFPSVRQLLTLDEARLHEIGWGYRAPRLYKLSRQLDERGPSFLLELLGQEEAEARAALMQVC